MRFVVDQLWLQRSKQSSYFGLVHQFLDVVPHIDAMKRSACIEGARMAFARVKAYWAEMDATTVAARDSAIGRKATEHYIEKVLEGASISTQYVLTRARAIHEPSMHADLFIALMHGTASRNCCTKLK